MPARARREHRGAGGLAADRRIVDPIAGVLVAGIEAWIALSTPAAAGIPFVLAVLALTLAMIGPGTWSVDALLYGRKHIPLPEP